jgi:hypothetical protein
MAVEVPMVHGRAAAVLKMDLELPDESLAKANDLDAEAD